MPSSKGCKKNKSIGDGSGMDNRGHIACIHPLMADNQTVHQVWEIFRLRTNKMNSFVLPCNRFADIVLCYTVIGILKPRVRDPVLNLNQFRFLAEVFTLSRLKQCHKALGPLRRGLGMFDFKRGFCLLCVEIAKCPS